MPVIHEGTLADLRTLMGHPPRMRRGYTSVDLQAQPVAGSNFTLVAGADYWRRINACAFTVATGATGGDRDVLLNYMDGASNIFNQVPVLPLAGSNKTFLCSGDLTAFPAESATGSFEGYGTQTSPAAGTTITSVVTTEPGSYLLEWSVELQGTTAAGVDNDNFEVTQSGTLVAQSVNSYQVGTYPQQSLPLEVSTAQTVAIKNINLATVGAVYSATMVLSGNGTLSPRFRIPDIVLQPGWQWQIQIVDIQATDQISGINLLTEHYASDWASGTDAREEDELLWRLAQVLSQG